MTKGPWMSYIVKLTHITDEIQSREIVDKVLALNAVNGALIPQAQPEVTFEH